MQLYDPTVQSPAHDFHRAAPLASINGQKIGLLTNSKVNADVLLRETAALFAQRHGCEVLEMASKSNASAPAPGETLASLADDCDFLITAMGD